MVGKHFFKFYGLDIQKTRKNLKIRKSSEKQKKQMNEDRKQKRIDQMFTRRPDLNQLNETQNRLNDELQTTPALRIPGGTGCQQ